MCFLRASGRCSLRKGVKILQGKGFNNQRHLFKNSVWHKKKLPSDTHKRIRKIFLEKNNARA